MTLSESLLRFPLSSAARTLLVGVVALIAFAGGLAPAAEAETRSLKLYNNHTGERATITFKRNGRYIQSGLRELNQFLRDWRRNESIKMDPKLFDLVWEVYQKSGSHKAIHVVSGYRSPATNNMLRKRSRGVAKKSQHMRGKAMDFFIPGANLAKLRATGLRMQVGGVGYYPTSGSPFVHMDTGNVRHWPRMTRKQLARVFPRGKTIHIPSDGKPMPGYKQALAELKARGSRDRQVAAASSDDRPSRALNTRGQVASNIRARPSIRPVPVGTNVGGKETSGRTLIASLFGRDGPKPPADVGDRERQAPARRDAPLPGVSSAKVTPPSKPGAAAIRVAEADETDAVATPDDAAVAAASGASPDQARDDPANADPEALDPEALEPEAQSDEAPIVVAALPSAKPARRGAAPDDPLGAIDSVVGPDTTRERRAGPNATLAAYAPGTEPVPALRPRPATVADDVLSAGPASNSPGGDRDRADRLRATRAAARGLGEGADVAARVDAVLAAARSKARAPVLSGRIPAARLSADADPFARFSRLPRMNEARLISADYSTRTRAFADLSHPDQRTLAALFARPPRLFNAGFERTIYGRLRTDRFDGPAVVGLSLVTAD